MCRECDYGRLQHMRGRLLDHTGFVREQVIREWNPYRGWCAIQAHRPDPSPTQTRRLS